MKIVTEKHLRTTAKAATYRVASVIMAMILTLAYGASITQALSFGAIAFVWGLTWFYIYDRIWLLLRWNRDESGKDTKLRSVIKSIVYRVVVISFSVFTARVVFTDSNLTAMLMATTQFVLNLVLYYTLERVWNTVQWGKFLPPNPDS